MAVLPGVRIRLLIAINDGEPTELAAIDAAGKARPADGGLELVFPPFGRLVRRLLRGAAWRAHTRRWIR